MKPLPVRSLKQPPELHLPDFATYTLLLTPVPLHGNAIRRGLLLNNIHPDIRFWMLRRRLDSGLFVNDADVFFNLI